jgi:hypothetical protein
VTRVARQLLVAGPVLGAAILILIGDAPVARWRVVALPTSLGAIAAGLAELVALGGQEWRRDRPALSRYARVGALFVAGFALAVAATT